MLHVYVQHTIYKYEYMDPITTAALVSGGLGLVGSFFQHHENSLSFDRQKELQKMQQEYNTNMWNMTNEYNSPAHQLALYKEANVNPNVAVDAISGTSRSTQPATPAVPSVSNTGSSASTLLQGIGTMTDYLIKQRQAQNIEAQTERTKIENKLLEKDLGIRDEMNQLSLEQYRANISKSLADSDLSRKKSEEIAYNLSEILPEIKKKTIVEREKIAQDMKLSVQQLVTEILQGQFLNERIKTERASRAQIYYQIEGLKFRNRVDALHAKYADEFSIDISGDKWQMIVEAVLAGGDNADAIIDALTETATGTVESAVDNVVKPVAGYVNKGFNRMRGIIGNAYKSQGNLPLYSPEQRLFYNLFGGIINP